MSLTNRGQGLKVRLAETGLESDDVVCLNDILCGVAVEDTGDSVAGTTVIEFPLTFSKVLSVVGEDNAGNTAIELGDRVYLDGAAYNADATNGVFIGFALGEVASGATTSIEVGIAQPGMA